MVTVDIITAGGERTRQLDNDFSVKLNYRDEDGNFVREEGVPETIKSPAITRDLQFEDSANVAQSTDLCGNTQAEAYGSRRNGVFTVECIITDTQSANNLSKDDVLNHMRKGATVKIINSIQTTVIEVTDVVINQTSDIKTIETVVDGRQSDTIVSSEQLAFVAQFQFGKKEDE